MTYCMFGIWVTRNYSTQQSCLLSFWLGVEAKGRQSRRTPFNWRCCINHPEAQGPLQLLLGPQRLEGGWWHRSPGFLADRAADDAPVSPQTAHTAVRDYWVAHNAQAGLLWIFHTRLAAQGGAWFLHGKFA